LYYHLIWATWDRRPLIDAEIGGILSEEVERTCRDLHCRVDAVGIVADHIHLLAALPPTLAVADFVKRVKGRSSHTINARRCADDWRFRWQEGYGALTVSPTDTGRVAEYVRNQKTRHANNHLWDLAELPPEDHAPSSA
jgi:REP element-mobilizing transposase RayT